MNCLIKVRLLDAFSKHFSLFKISIEGRTKWGLVSSVQMKLQNRLEGIGIFQNDRSVIYRRDYQSLPEPVRISTFIVDEIKIGSFPEIITKLEVG